MRPSARNTTRSASGGGARVVGDHHGRLAVELDGLAQERRAPRRRPRSRGCRSARRRTAPSAWRRARGRSRRAAAGRRRARPAVAAAVGEADARRAARRARRAVGLARRRSRAAGRRSPPRVSIGQQVEGLEDEADVAAAQLGQRLVAHRGDVLAADVDGALGRAVEAGEQVHQRRLAGARRAHDGGELAGGDVQRDAAQGVDGGLALAVAAGDGAGGDGRRRRRGAWPRAWRDGAGTGCGPFVGERSATAAPARDAGDGAVEGAGGSSAAVASASERPGRPPPGRTETEARHLAAGAGGREVVVDVEPTGPVARSASRSSSASWTSTSKPTRRPASRPLTRVRAGAQARRPSGRRRSKGMGAQRAHARGSVRASSTASGAGP